MGLPDVAGLLVLEVAPGGAPGIQAGDLLVAVDGVELRSCVTLAEHPAPRTLELLRGAERHTVRL